jgi:hypothetical protein
MKVPTGGSALARGPSLSDPMCDSPGNRSAGRLKQRVLGILDDRECQLLRFGAVGGDRDRELGAAMDRGPFVACGEVGEELKV